MKAEGRYSGRNGSINVSQQAAVQHGVWASYRSLAAWRQRRRIAKARNHRGAARAMARKINENEHGSEWRIALIPGSIARLFIAPHGAPAPRAHG